MRQLKVKGRGFILIESIIGLVIVASVIAFGVDLIMKNSEVVQHAKLKLQAGLMAGNMELEYRILRKSGTVAGELGDGWRYRQIPVSSKNELQTTVIKDKSKYTIMNYELALQSQ